MSGSAYMTALKRGERLLTVRVLELERLLHQKADEGSAEEWEAYTWGLYVLTLVAQATGSAPRGGDGAAAPALLSSYRAGAARRPPVAAPRKP